MEYKNGVYGVVNNNKEVIDMKEFRELREERMINKIKNDIKGLVMSVLGVNVNVDDIRGMLFEGVYECVLDRKEVRGRISEVNWRGVVGNVKVWGSDDEYGMNKLVDGKEVGVGDLVSLKLSYVICFGVIGNDGIEMLEEGWFVNDVSVIEKKWVCVCGCCGREVSDLSDGLCFVCFYKKYLSFEDV